MRKRLTRRSRIATGTRNSGFCHSGLAKFDWASSGLSQSGVGNSWSMNPLGPASCTCTTRRSKECRYRPTSLQRSQPSSRLTRRTKAPRQPIYPSRCSQCLRRGAGVGEEPLRAHRALDDATALRSLVVSQAERLGLTLASLLAPFIVGCDAEATVAQERSLRFSRSL